MPLKINVPYSEKDLAKEKGAFWDKDNKTWFVPDYKDINLFSQWIDTDKVSIIAKAPFWIGVTQKTCWKCGGMIDVIAFASNKFWIYEYSDDDEALQEWYLQDYFSFFYMPGYIYNPQIQISAESETKRSIFREKDKTKRSKKESAQHSKSRNKSFVMTSVSAL